MKSGGDSVDYKLLKKMLLCVFLPTIFEQCTIKPVFPLCILESSCITKTLFVWGKNTCCFSFSHISLFLVFITAIN